MEEVSLTRMHQATIGNMDGTNGQRSSSHTGQSGEEVGKDCGQPVLYIVTRWSISCSGVYI